MAHYNTDSAWNDPFERPRENRQAPRFDVRMAAVIAVQDVASQQSLRGRGLVRNMSYTGLRVATKHQLAQGQEVTVALSTKHCREDLCLPKIFAGPAEVVRIEHNHDGYVDVALRFGERFLEDMEFAVFVDALKRAAGQAKRSAPAYH